MSRANDQRRQGRAHHELAAHGADNWARSYPRRHSVRWSAPRDLHSDRTWVSALCIPSPNPSGLTLTLRYQVRVGLLNAGMYGAPQNRRRFFIVASDAEHELPDFPHPTHAFPKSLTLKIPAFPEARPSWPVVESTRTGDDYDIMRQPPLCVPHPTVTLKDGIGDLHKFDWCALLLLLSVTQNLTWINPRKSSERRPQRPVDAFLCKPKGCEPTFRTPYAMEPANEVQARARRDSAGITFRKLQHKTAGFFQYIVEK